MLNESPMEPVHMNSMLLGLIVRRIGNYFQIYSTLGDFRLAVSECGEDYDVGKWVGLRVNGSDITDYGLARSDLLRDLPEVRVHHNVAEVLTKGILFWRNDCSAPLCKTADFGIIPVVCRLPTTAEIPQSDVKIWARSLSEEGEFGKCSWAVVEFVEKWDTPHSSATTRTVNSDKNKRVCDFRSSSHGGKKINLEGLIISNPSVSYNGGSKAYIWTRYERESFEGVLDYGSNPREFCVFRMGQWIEFSLLWDDVRAVLDQGGRFRISSRDCSVVKGPFPTQTTRAGLEIEVPLSIPVGHLQGDDFYHEEIGAISDPDMLLHGGQEYEAALIRILPRPSTIENEVSEWKIVRALASGESWAPSFSRKKSKIKRPLCGRVKPRPLQRDAVDSSPLAKSIIPPGRSLENGPDEQGGDKVDREDKRRWVVEPKSVDPSTRQAVTALAMVELKLSNGKYRVWMLEYHREAEFCTTRLLDPGHFFQGRFHIGGRNKDKCHEYIQGVPDLLAGRFIPEENEVEVLVRALHANRKNGAHYEVFHDCLGYVLDTFDLLRQVESRTQVEIAARRKPAVNGGRLIWQVVNVNRIK